MCFTVVVACYDSNSLFVMYITFVVVMVEKGDVFHYCLGKDWQNKYSEMNRKGRHWKWRLGDLAAGEAC